MIFSMLGKILKTNTKNNKQTKKLLEQLNLSVALKEMDFCYLVNKFNQQKLQPNNSE